MKDLFEKISRAADAFADIITEDVKPDQTIKLYTYDDFRRTFFKKKREYPQIQKCTISIQQGKEFDDMVFAENKYIIRILMLDKEKRPICVKGSPGEYVGGLVFSDGIDRQLKEFMGDKTEKTVVLGGK